MTDTATDTTTATAAETGAAEVGPESAAEVGPESIDVTAQLAALVDRWETILMSGPQCAAELREVLGTSRGQTVAFGQGAIQFRA